MGDRKSKRTTKEAAAFGGGLKQGNRSLHQEALNDVLNSSVPGPLSRKSLSDRTLVSEQFTKLAETMTFAREPMVMVTPRRSRASFDGETFIFGNDDEEDNLDDFQRAVRCLKSDYKTFAVENFDRLIKEDEARAMAEVWPRLESELMRTAAEAASPDTDIPMDVEEPVFETIHEPASRKLPVTIVHLYKTGNGDAARELLALAFYLMLSSNEEISMYWGECLQKLVEACHSSDVHEDIYPILAELAVGGKSVSVNGKVGVCRVLQKLARRLTPTVIEKKVFPMIHALAKDRNSAVRAVAASCLQEMIHRMKNKDDVLALISEAKEDNNPNVKTALTATILKSITLMDPTDENSKAYLETVLQTIKLLVKEAYWKRNVDLLVAYSERMGLVCEVFSAANIMTGRDIQWYLDAFLQLSKYDAKVRQPEGSQEEEEMPAGFRNFRAYVENANVDALMSTKSSIMVDKSAVQKAINNAIAVLRANAGGGRMSAHYPERLSYSDGDSQLDFGVANDERAYECRKNTAKQFCAFMKFAHRLVGFKNGLRPIVSELMRDPQPEVRAAMAENLLPIMEQLKGDAGLLSGELVHVLSDDDVDVIQALAPTISRVLKCLVVGKVLSPKRISQKLIEIGGALLYCEERLNQTTYYKVHQLMLEQFSILPFCFPGDYVYNNFIPVLFHRLHNMKLLPCRMAAAGSIVISLRYCYRNYQREDIRKRIITGFARGRSVHERMLFLYMIKKIMERFSRKYFREHFFEHIIVLAHDPVGNVRRKVMELMPELQEEAADDPSLNEKVRESISHARKTEVDRDVIEKIAEAAAKIEQNDEEKDDQDMVEPGQMPNGKSMNGSQKTKSDPLDITKEMEEEFIESMEVNRPMKPPRRTDGKKRDCFKRSGRDLSKIGCRDGW